MSGFDQPSLIAGGTIKPFRFIKFTTTASTAVQATAQGERVIGVTTGATRAAPFDGVTANAAESGDTIEWLPAGRVVLIEADSTGLTRNDLVTTASDGSGDVAESGDFVAGIALDTIAADTVGEIWLFSPSGIPLA